MFTHYGVALWVPEVGGAIDPGSITPPGTAKNCLTVGASENNRPNMTMTYVQGWPGAYKANPIRDDLVAKRSGREVRKKESTAGLLLCQRFDGAIKFGNATNRCNDRLDRKRAGKSLE